MSHMTVRQFRLCDGYSVIKVGGSAKKVGLRIRELERIYGVREGSSNKKGINQYVGEPNYSVATKTNLKRSLTDMQNFLKLGETGMLDYPQLTYAVYRNFAFFSEVTVFIKGTKTFNTLYM